MNYISYDLWYIIKHIDKYTQHTISNNDSVPNKYRTNMDPTIREYLLLLDSKGPTYKFDEFIDHINKLDTITMEEIQQLKENKNMKSQPKYPVSSTNSSRDAKPFKLPTGIFNKLSTFRPPVTAAGGGGLNKINL